MLIAGSGAEEPVVTLGPDVTVVDVATGERAPVVQGGRLIHLQFFATWCPPCLDQLPAMADLRARWEEDGYVAVLVAVPDRQDVERLRTFAGGQRAAARILLDVDGSLARALGVDAIPTHVVLDADGRVRARGASPSEVAPFVESTMRRSR